MPSSKHLYIIGGIILLAIILILSFEYKEGKLPSMGETSTSTNTGTRTEKEVEAPVAEKPSANTPPKETTPVSTGTGSSKGFVTYSNKVLGFSVKYPSYVTPRSDFFSFNELGTQWRLYPHLTNQGKAVISFPIFSRNQGTSYTGKEAYPLYYASEVRVGTSDNTAKCYDKDADFPNQVAESVTINGVAFKRFKSTQTVGTGYVEAESYRTVRNGKCFVIERMKNMSTIKKDGMKQDITDQTLLSYYTLGDTIIKSFTFTK